MAQQFANCLSVLSSIKMWDKLKACLILESGSTAQTQTSCLCVIMQCTRGKGERYNSHCGRHSLLIRGYERHKKDCSVPENNVSVIRLSRLSENLYCPSSQRDKETFKHLWFMQAWKGMIDGMPEDRIHCVREAQIEIRWQKVLIWQQKDQEVCIWSFSMTHMCGCLERMHAHKSGYHCSSVISVSRLCFLIVDMAAISWMWKKQNWLKSYAPSKV